MKEPKLYPGDSTSERSSHPGESSAKPRGEGSDFAAMFGTDEHSRLGPLASVRGKLKHPGMMCEEEEVANRIFAYAKPFVQRGWKNYFRQGAASRHANLPATVCNRLPMKIGALLLLTVVGARFPLMGQPGEDLKTIRTEIQDLKEGQKAIQKDLARIKEILLEKRPAAPASEISLNVEDAPFIGESTAKVTVVEFTDFQCTFCGRHAAQTLPRILTDYVKTGLVKYVVRDYPLESHPAAWKAAEAAQCAREQGKYWEMHDQMFANQKALEQKDLSFYAKTLGLNEDKFDQCLATGKNATLIRKNLTEAQQAGVDAAPTFYFAMTEQNGSTVKTVTKIVGALPYSAFKAAVDNLISTDHKK